MPITSSIYSSLYSSVSRSTFGGEQNNSQPYPTYRIVAQGGQMADSELTGLGFTRCTTRYTFRVGRYPVNTPIYILFTGKRLYQGGEVANANSLTLSVYVEKLTGGAAVAQATIDGSTSKVLGPSGYCFAKISPSDFSLSEFPAGFVGYIRTQVDVPTGGKWYYGLTSPHERPAGNSVLMGVSSDTSQLNSTGAFSVTAVTGTAQSGTTSTITLAAGASAVDDFYTGKVIRLTAGTSAGQYRVITGYVGATKVATVSSVYSIAPDATSQYSIGQQALSYGGFGPTAIIGGWTSTEDLSIAIHGDSIAAGQSDATFNGSTGGGFFKAGIAAVGGIPFVSIARAGEQASNWSDPTKDNSLRKMIFGWCTHLMTNIGSNDLLSTSAATAETNIKAIFASFRAKAQGPKYILHTPVIPRTNASNTTPATDYGIGEARDVLNASMYANTGKTGYHDDWADTNSTLATAALWASGTYTSDGVHPNTTGYPIAVPVITNRVQYFTSVNPSLMSSVVAHFDVSKPWTFDVSGGVVSQWRDIISQGANYATAAGSTRPSYSATGLAGSKPAITFDGTDDLMSLLTEIVSSSGYNVFVVTRPIAATGTNRTVLSSNAVGGFQILVNTTNKIQISKRQSSVLCAGSTTLLSTETYVLQTQTTSGNTLVRALVDGTQDAISTNPPTFTEGIKYIGGRGSGEYWKDPISEIIIFKETGFSATDQTNVMAHLATKWGA